jgi:FMN phosphatase YigB (HAD superfamily)
MKIGLICFDLGGVLVEICRNWAEGCRAAGLEVRSDSASAEADRVRRGLSISLGKGDLSEDQWAERLSAELGALYSPAELKRIHHAWSQSEYPGALELIDELHAAGVMTACLSNTNHSHWTRLIHHDGERDLDGTPEYPAVKRLQHRYASHLLRLHKPEPEIYETFERLTGLPGNSILFFDDLPENVAGARSRDWYAELVDPSRPTIPQLRRFLAAHGVL